jgi:hypothetical protein
MEEALALLDQLIEEHKQIRQRIQTTEQVANDTVAILELDKAKEDFMPGRFSNQKQDLQNLLVSLETVEKGLQAHFGREENRLLVILQKHGGERLTSGLRILFLEHGELQNRIAESKKEVAELAASGLSREVGEGKAWGIRVYISHTRKLIEVHAQSEEELFHKLRAELKQA